MNKLPKYWIVRNDKSQKFKDTVIKHLNETYILDLNGMGYDYYGYDGSWRNRGVNCWDNIETFENNPTLLTIDEFIEMTKETDEFKRGEMVLDYGNDEVEFICDLGEDDMDGDRYVIKEKGLYYFRKTIKKIEPTIEIAGKKYRIKDIEENIKPLN